ncbi:hypothetical protein QIH85_26530 [Bradyrhizobium japonicum]|nr:hypothetical protein [Bradyrhizobium japonicum]WLB25416.1 hypothetical protein QIH85_26530 [Bradyrhizobium japonicum]
MMAPDVAGEKRAAAIRRDRHVLGDVGAVEHQRIRSRVTFDGVAAVTRIPREDVIACAEKSDVVAAAADDLVVSVAADQGVGALTAGDGIVARAAIDRQPNRRSK